MSKNKGIEYRLLALEMREQIRFGGIEKKITKVEAIRTKIRAQMLK